MEGLWYHPETEVQYFTASSRSAAVNKGAQRASGSVQLDVKVKGSEADLALTSLKDEYLVIG